MLFPARMKKATIIVPRDRKDRLIRTLHEAGIAQIIPAGKKESAALLESAADVGVLLGRIERLFEAFEKARPEPGMKEVLHEILNPVKAELHEVDPVGDFRGLIEECGVLLESAEAGVAEQEKRMAALDGREAALKERYEKISRFAGVDADLSMAGETPSTVTFLGLTHDPGALAASLPGLAQLSTIDISGSESFAAIICHKSAVGYVEEAKRSRLFVQLETGGLKGRPSELVREIEAEIERSGDERAVIDERLLEIAGRYGCELEISHDQLSQARARINTLMWFDETAYTASLQCWIEAKEAKELEDLCAGALGPEHVIHFLDAGAEEDPPVKQQNPRITRPFQAIVNMYSPPRYDEVDPTVVVAITFVLFFSLMLGDAGYGILILGISLFLYVKYRNVDEEISLYCMGGVILGLTTTIIGLMLNSFFGDFLPRLVYNDTDLNIFGRGEPFSVGGLPVPYDSLRNPLPLLSISLYAGLGGMNTGLVLAAINNLSHRRWKEFATTQGAWWLVQPACAILLGKYMLQMAPFEGMGTPMVMLAGAMLAAGMGLMFWGKGIMSSFDLTGFIGDWFSFSRIMALGLGTVGMAMAINILAWIIYDMLGSGILVVLAIIMILLLLVIGHLANLLLQILGAAVHTLRLEYVEIFSKFYEGGGGIFAPFRENRQFTRVARTLTDYVRSDSISTNITEET